MKSSRFILVNRSIDHRNRSCGRWFVPRKVHEVLRCEQRENESEFHIIPSYPVRRW